MPFPSRHFSPQRPPQTLARGPDTADRVDHRPRPHAWELIRALGRNGTELLHHGDAIELRPDVGHATVLEAVEVHALDPDRLAGGGDPHELLLQRTGHDPPGGDGVAAGDDVLQVLQLADVDGQLLITALVSYRDPALAIRCGLPAVLS